MSSVWSQQDWDRRAREHTDWVTSGGASGKLLSLTKAILADIVVRGAALDGVDCSGAAFYRCDFTGVSMNACRFSHASLQDCVFDSAELVDAVFSQSVVQGTSFAGCNLRGSYWRHANLRRVDLTASLLEGAQFEDCQCDRVTWPSPLPAHIAAMIDSGINR